MLVDPNKIDHAISQLREAALMLNRILEDQRDGKKIEMAWASSSILVGQVVQTLTTCVNQGYGDHSEPTTYAELLASAREWAHDRIEEDPDADRDEIIENAAANEMVRLAHTQALIEVFMTKIDLIGVSLGNTYEYPIDAMKEAVRLALIEDMQDLIDNEEETE